MAATIPTTEPDSIVAGDSAIWTKTLSDYPATDGWTLTYTIQTADGGEFQSFTTGTSGASFAVNVMAAITATWVPGKYDASAKVTSLSGEVHTVWQGQLTVKAAMAQGTDRRTHARRVLDNIEAVLEKKATREILNSEVSGVKLERIPVDQLLVLRDRYKIEVQREEAALRIAAGLAPGRKIFTRFRTTT